MATNGANVNIAEEQGGNAHIFGGATDRRIRIPYNVQREAFLAAAGPHAWGVWDDFRGGAGAALDATKGWRTDLSTGATILTAATQPQAAGAIGAAEFITDTDDNDHATLVRDLEHLVSGGWGFVEVRLTNITATTLRAVEVGFSDALLETNGLAFSSHSTPTAVADDAAIMAINSDETLANWTCCTVNGAGTPTTADSGVAVAAAATWQNLRVEIDEAGNASFFIAGVLVAYQALAVATTALLTPWISLKSLSGAAKTMQVDYVFGGGYSGLSR